MFFDASYGKDDWVARSPHNCGESLLRRTPQVRVRVLLSVAMSQRSRFALSAVLVACLAAPGARAAVVWNESIDGDLSGNRLIPTTLAMGTGSNEIVGTTVHDDRDYFRFSLSPGQALTQIVVRGYEGVDEFSFLAVQAGTVITEDPIAPDVGNLLGWSLWGTADIGNDILARMGTGQGAIGFVPPLTGSNYAFWLQQTGDETSYRLDFVVVPEPATLAVLAAGVGCVARRRRRV